MLREAIPGLYLNIPFTPESGCRTTPTHREGSLKHYRKKGGGINLAVNLDTYGNLLHCICRFDLDVVHPHHYIWPPMLTAASCHGAAGGTAACQLSRERNVFEFKRSCTDLNLEHLRGIKVTILFQRLHTHCQNDPFSRAFWQRNKWKVVGQLHSRRGATYWQDSAFNQASPKACRRLILCGLHLFFFFFFGSEKCPQKYPLAVQMS